MRGLMGLGGVSGTRGKVSLLTASVELDTNARPVEVPRLALLVFP